MAGFLRGVVESERGENGNESIGSRRVASVLGRGSEVFETGLEEDGRFLGLVGLVFGDDFFEL